MKLLPEESKLRSMLISGIAALALLVAILWVLAVARTPKSLPAYGGTLASESVTPSAPPTTMPTATSAPTWDGQAYVATAEALFRTLPTASPIPGLAPDKQLDQQHTDLWTRA